MFIQSSCFKLVYEGSVGHRVKGLSEIKKHCCNFVAFLHLSLIASRVPGADIREWVVDLPERNPHWLGAIVCEVSK